MPVKLTFNFKRGDIAKVQVGRGSPGMVEITEVHGEEVVFRYTNGKTDRLYAVHLYRDAECMQEGRRRLAAKNEQAKMIGRKHKK